MSARTSAGGKRASVGAHAAIVCSRAPQRQAPGSTPHGPQAAAARPQPARAAQSGRSKAPLPAAAAPRVFGPCERSRAAGRPASCVALLHRWRPAEAQAASHQRAGRRARVLCSFKGGGGRQSNGRQGGRRPGAARAPAAGKGRARRAGGGTNQNGYIEVLNAMHRSWKQKEGKLWAHTRWSFGWARPRVSARAAPAAGACGVQPAGAAARATGVAAAGARRPGRGRRSARRARLPPARAVSGRGDALPPGPPTRRLCGLAAPPLAAPPLRLEAETVHLQPERARADAADGRRSRRGSGTRAPPRTPVPRACFASGGSGCTAGRPRGRRPCFAAPNGFRSPLRLEADPVHLQPERVRAAAADGRRPCRGRWSGAATTPARASQQPSWIALIRHHCVLRLSLCTCSLNASGSSRSMGSDRGKRSVAPARSCGRARGWGGVCFGGECNGVFVCAAVVGMGSAEQPAGWSKGCPARHPRPRARLTHQPPPAAGRDSTRSHARGARAAAPSKPEKRRRTSVVSPSAMRRSLNSIPVGLR